MSVLLFVAVSNTVQFEFQFHLQLQFQFSWHFDAHYLLEAVAPSCCPSTAAVSFICGWRLVKLITWFLSLSLFLSLHLLLLVKSLSQAAKLHKKE